ncbi:putative quinol monooxygenase [Weissella soli]|uniref:putative quinol monooxygenase n=1 Tax=Weissella soli TaxID=155866 RepID=UPI0035A16257
MSSIMYLIETTVKEENKAAALELIDCLVASTKKEEGAVDYHWSINGDKINIIEHYADNAATKLHLDGFAVNFGEYFSNLFDVHSCTVYGDPNAEVKEILDGFGAVYMTTVNGFVNSK